MRSSDVQFYSEGSLVRGFLRVPDSYSSTESSMPAVVHGPGWLGLASAASYEKWHAGFTAAGYAVLAFDYRGFGGSDGERGWVKPAYQLEDIVNAVTYLTTLSEIDSNRIGIFGMGGTGGGNAIAAAAADPRIKAVIAQSVVADGEDWLRRMRREYEWIDYLNRLAEDSRRWVLDGQGEQVHPREGIMVETPERRENANKKDVDAKMPDRFFLRSAEFIMRYRPIDVVHLIAPRALLLTAVAGDVVTPEDHAERLFQAAGPPKRLIMQRDTTHYLASKKNYELLMQEFVEWFDTHLAYSSIETREQIAGTESYAHL